MPTRPEAESLALRALDIIHSGAIPEWDELELKRAFIDPAKAAVRIAAQANQRRGEWFIWIVGVDESKDPPEVATPVIPGDGFERWWQQVQSHFDGPAPDLRWYFPVVDEDHLPGRHPMVLCFEPSAPPYVVGARDERRTPWRDGDRTRNASRAELLRMVVPAGRAADFEPVEVLVVRADIDLRRTGGTVNTLGVFWSLFVCHPAMATVVVPTRQVVGALELQGIEYELEGFSFSGDQEAVTVTSQQATVRGVGQLQVRGYIAPVPPRPTETLVARASLRLLPANAERWVTHQADVIIPPKTSGDGRWGSVVFSARKPPER